MEGGGRESRTFRTLSVVGEGTGREGEGEVKVTGLGIAYPSFSECGRWRQWKGVEGKVKLVY